MIVDYIIIDLGNGLFNLVTDDDEKFNLTAEDLRCLIPSNASVTTDYYSRLQQRDLLSDLPN